MMALRNNCALVNMSKLMRLWIHAILKLGPGTELAKIDIQNAYRIVPVHPEDRPLLSMKWQGTYCPVQVPIPE